MTAGFDSLAWSCIRMIMFIQGTLLSWIYQIAPPRKLGEKIDAMGAVFGAFAIARMTSPDQTPGIIRDKLLPIGRLIVIFTIAMTAWGILKKVATA